MTNSPFLSIIKRLDVLAKLRGLDSFEKLWERRLTVKLPHNETNKIEVIGIEDLVQSKNAKRQRLVNAQFMKERFDSLLVNLGLFPSRETAKRAILAGEVLVDEKRLTKSGTKVESTAKIRLLGKESIYVSRGGKKIKKALLEFKVDVLDKVAIDVGSSTGGFTDCLLREGARKVFAVDVGTNQLDWQLRTDKRVIPMEKKDIRNVSLQDLDEIPEVATVDVSFISLKNILPKVFSLLKDGGKIIALIKPQFEVGRKNVGKGGVVRDPALQEEAVSGIKKFAEGMGLLVIGITPSPITGRDGNREFFIALTKEEIG